MLFGPGDSEVGQSDPKQENNYPPPVYRKVSVWKIKIIFEVGDRKSLGVFSW
jgi:hypothetical protein